MNKNKTLNKSFKNLFIAINIILLGIFFLADDFIFFFQSKILIFLIIATFLIPSIQYYFFNQRVSYIPIGEIILIFFIFAYLTIFLLDRDSLENSYSWLLVNFSFSKKKLFLEHLR